MAWMIKDEWIDLAAARHVVVFHNPDVSMEVTAGGKTKAVPVEHHLYHHFKLDACPHCGVPGETKDLEDFHQTKAKVLQALNEHHQQVMAYRELHPKVRIASGPKL